MLCDELTSESSRCFGVQKLWLCVHLLQKLTIILDAALGIRHHDCATIDQLQLLQYVMLILLIGEEGEEPFQAEFDIFDAVGLEIAFAEDEDELGPLDCPENVVHSDKLMLLVRVQQTLSRVHETDSSLQAAHLRKSMLVFGDF